MRASNGAKVGAMGMDGSEVPEAVLEMAHGGVRYWAEGVGVPVVALHGVPGSGRDFRRLGAALPRERVRMIRVNLPGFAGSAALPRGDDLGALVQVVAEAAERLAGGPFVVLGHSFGGLLALRVAARSRLAVGLALLAPAGLRPHRAIRRLGPRVGLRALGASRVGRELFYRALVRTSLGAWATRADTDATLALLARLDFAPSVVAARALKLPVFCAYCLDDALVEPEIVDELMGALNVQKRLTFERGGHAPQKDHAEEIAAALAEFVGSLVSS